MFLFFILISINTIAQIAPTLGKAITNDFGIHEEDTVSKQEQDKIETICQLPVENSGDLGGDPESRDEVKEARDNEKEVEADGSDEIADNVVTFENPEKYPESREEDQVATGNEKEDEADGSDEIADNGETLGNPGRYPESGEEDQVARDNEKEVEADGSDEIADNVETLGNPGRYPES